MAKRKPRKLVPAGVGLFAGIWLLNVLLGEMVKTVARDLWRKIFGRPCEP